MVATVLSIPYWTAHTAFWRTSFGNWRKFFQTNTCILEVTKSASHAGGCVLVKLHLCLRFGFCPLCTLCHLKCYLLIITSLSFFYKFRHENLSCTGIVNLILLGRIAVLRSSMWPIVTNRIAWSVCRSVTLVSPAKTADWDAVWVVDSGGPRESWLHGVPDPRIGRGNFEWGERDTLWWAVQIRLNRSRCRLGYGLGWAKGIMC